MARRILILNTDLEIGGTPTVVRELAIRLHAPARGVEVEVACVAPWGPMADAIAAAGLVVTPLDADDVFDLPLVVRRLVKLIRSREIDTVFSFLVHANTVAAIASRFCRNVRFIQAIQTTQPRPRWHWWMQSVVHEAAEAVVVPSPSVAQAAQERSGVAREKLIIIPNAVDLDQFPYPGPGNPGPASTGPHAVGIEIAFLGRLDPVKRVPDLIEAVARLDSAAVRLNVYGDGPMRTAIEDRIVQFGLRDRVRLCGVVPAAEALAASDLLVLPSEAEGFPLVLIEAMAAGVPIVATDAPGIRDVIHHGRTGLLVPVGDVEALAATIGRCVEDAPLRQQLPAQGRAEVERKYTWAQVLRQYERLLGLESPTMRPGATPAAHP